MSVDARRLRGLISRSRVLDPALKRAWLRVLPLMEQGHRRELAEILELEARASRAAGGPARGGVAAGPGVLSPH